MARSSSVDESMTSRRTSACLDVRPQLLGDLVGVDVVAGVAPAAAPGRPPRRPPGRARTPAPWPAAAPRSPGSRGTAPARRAAPPSTRKCRPEQRLAGPRAARHQRRRAGRSARRRASASSPGDAEPEPLAGPGRPRSRRTPTRSAGRRAGRPSPIVKGWTPLSGARPADLDHVQQPPGPVPCRSRRSASTTSQTVSSPWLGAVVDVALDRRPAWSPRGRPAWRPASRRSAPRPPRARQQARACCEPVEHDQRRAAAARAVATIASSVSSAPGPAGRPR